MLTHLVALSVEHKSGRDNVLECYAIEHHSGDGMECEEPSTCLVDALVDEVGGIELRRDGCSLVCAVDKRLTVFLCAACHLSLERIVELCVRHRS